MTSQQDIDSITKVKGNDFSKIQGRFDTRLSLSSANVDAVIKKRILEKTEPAAQTLRLLYEQKATIIKNLIVFNDTAEKKLYASAEDFAEELADAYDASVEHRKNVKPYAMKLYNEKRCELDMGWLYIWANLPERGTK